MPFGTAYWPSKRSTSWSLTPMWRMSSVMFFMGA